MLDIAPLKTRDFYQRILGSEMTNLSSSCTSFRLGGVELEFRSDRTASTPISDKGYLIVLHTDNIEASFESLSSLGLRFARGVGFSEIGGTARFVDPNGYAFCLYQPSQECLKWPSGSKVLEIINSTMTQ